jgi:hypothetical protein
MKLLPFFINKECIMENVIKMSEQKNESIIEKDLEYFKVDKEEWNRTITLNKRKVLKIFLAGAIVSTVIWSLVFWVYVQTGFIW